MNILQQLTNYTETRKEFEFCDRHNGQWDWTSFSDRWQVAKNKLERFSFPPREQVEAACLEELQQLASKASQLLQEWRGALQVELDALKAWRVAEVALEYANLYHILEIDRQAAQVEAREARAAFELASAKARTVSITRNQIEIYINEQYPGCVLKTPTTFEAAARERVERVLGAYYGQPEPVGQRWG